RSRCTSSSIARASCACTGPAGCRKRSLNRQSCNSSSDNFSRVECLDVATSSGCRRRVTIVGGLCLQLAACGGANRPATPVQAAGFDADIAFLRQHTQVVVLADPSGSAQVAVAPAYQGRVMTSTTGGSSAPSFGWIGRAAIASGKRQPHMNVFGGEDRFWLGPEGGQFALYFKPGDPFDLDHWQGPGADRLG